MNLFAIFHSLLMKTQLCELLPCQGSALLHASDGSVNGSSNNLAARTRSGNKKTPNFILNWMIPAAYLIET